MSGLQPERMQRIHGQERLLGRIWSQWSFTEGPAHPCCLCYTPSSAGYGPENLPAGGALWEGPDTHLRDVSCVNLDQRLISHDSWSAFEEGAQPFIQQMEKLRPRKVTFMPKVTQSAGSGAKVGIAIWALGLLTCLPLSH